MSRGWMGSTRCLRDEHDLTTPNAIIKREGRKFCRACYYARRARKKANERASKPLYGIWIDMKKRCAYARHRFFNRYGGRGITVCERWVTDYHAFAADMGPRPTPRHTLDRVDNNGNYEPGNCRWATRREQANNRNTSRRVEFDGEILTVAEWSRRLGVPYKVLYARIQRGLALTGGAKEIA